MLAQHTQEQYTYDCDIACRKHISVCCFSASIVHCSWNSSSVLICSSLFTCVVIHKLLSSSNLELCVSLCLQQKLDSKQRNSDGSHQAKCDAVLCCALLRCAVIHFVSVSEPAVLRVGHRAARAQPLCASTRQACKDKLALTSLCC